MNEKTQEKIAATLEVFGIYVVGQLVGFVLAKVLGIPLRNPLTDLTLQTTSPEIRQITIFNTTALTTSFSRVSVSLAIMCSSQTAVNTANTSTTRQQRPLPPNFVAST